MIGRFLGLIIYIGACGAALLGVTQVWAQTAIRPDQICPGGVCGTPDITWQPGGTPPGYVIGSTVPWRTNSTATIAATDFGANDLGRNIELSFAGPITAAIPPATGTFADGAGFTIQVKSGSLTLTTASGTINGIPGTTGIKVGPYQAVGLVSKTSNWYAVLSVPQPATVSGKVLSDNMTWITPTGGTGPASCTDADNFLARVLTAGTTLDTNHSDSYKRLICGLVTPDALWSTIDALYLFATQDSTTAKLNLKSASYPITANGAMTHTADVGYVGVSPSSTAYLNTGFNASTAGGNFSQNSATIVVWDFTSAIGTGIPVGAVTTPNTSQILPRTTGDISYFFLNSDSSNAGITVNGTSNGTGSWIASRTTGTLLTGYHNGTALSPTDTHNATVLPNQPFYLSNRNNGGSADAGSTDQLAAAAFASGWNATQAAAFHARVCTFLQAVHTTC